MPSKSPAQKRMMAAAAHNPEFAKKVGVPVSVAREFNQADELRHKHGTEIGNKVARDMETMDHARSFRKKK
jgi:hypothetical protein